MFLHHPKQNRGAINHSLNSPPDLLPHDEKVAELKIKHQDKLISAIKSYAALLSPTGKAAAEQGRTLLIEPAEISDGTLKRF